MKEDDCVFCDETLKVSRQRALTLEVTGFCRGVIEVSRSSGLLRPIHTYHAMPMPFPYHAVPLRV